MGLGISFVIGRFLSLKLDKGQLVRNFFCNEAPCFFNSKSVNLKCPSLLSLHSSLHFAIYFAFIHLSFQDISSSPSLPDCLASHSNLFFSSQLFPIRLVYHLFLFLSTPPSSISVRGESIVLLRAGLFSTP